MSALRKILIASALTFAAAAPALAEGGDRWTLEVDRGYVVDVKGNMSSYRMSTTTLSAMMKHAKPVPAGTMILQHDGKLYMVKMSSSMFDRSGGCTVCN